MTITRDEYLKALAIVESYHNQLNLQIDAIRFTKIKDLNVGDFVRCTHVDGNTKKCLTVGKDYRIEGFSGSKHFFVIIDDHGKEKQYVTHRSAFKPIIPNYA